MYKLYFEKGITLISIIVTILILLILAGVSIRMVIGNNGIISQADTAATDYFHASVVEALRMKVSQKRLLQKYKNVKDSQYLRDEGFLDNSGIVNVNYLLGSNNKMGSGSWQKGNIYQVFGGELIYFDNNLNRETIDRIYNETFVMDTGTKTIIGLYYEIQEDGKRVYTGPSTLIVPEYLEGEKVEKIDDWLLAKNEDIDYTKIEKIIFECDLEKIPTGFCYGLPNLKVITIGNSIKEIGEHAFEDCSNLKSINLSNSNLEIIGSYAFNRSGLEYISLSKTIKTINEYAFFGTHLSKIIFPTSITYIDNNAFNGLSMTFNFEGPESSIPSGKPWGSTSYQINYNHK